MKFKQFKGSRLLNFCVKFEFEQIKMSKSKHILELELSNFLKFKKVNNEIALKLKKIRTVLDYNYLTVFIDDSKKKVSIFIR